MEKNGRFREPGGGGNVVITRREFRARKFEFHGGGFYGATRFLELRGADDESCEVVGARRKQRLGP